MAWQWRQWRSISVAAAAAKSGVKKRNEMKKMVKMA
jgi:hypothetical protein